ncbi:Long-chain-fatty-acid--CoA ligase [Candidatus Magnetomorum sp. HK-1]|nr:Long-chain-fatty-acid--CoA ligase [Candidatus Magnetomorum sp. HK-1]
MNETLSYTDQPWVNNYPDGVNTHIDYHRKTIPELLERSAQEYPETVALIFEGYEINYRTLKNMVDQFSNYLLKLNVRKGDCVALILPNVIPCVVGYLGILQVGAIAVFINPTSSDREMEHQLNDSEATMIITLDLICNRIIDLRPRLVNVHHIIYTSLGDYLPLSKKISFSLLGKHRKITVSVNKAPDVYRWKDLFSKQESFSQKITAEYKDIAIYQYTSGTTGGSKGVILTHNNLSKQVQQLQHWFWQLKPANESILAALPFFHIFGLSSVLNFSIANAWTTILLPKPHPCPLYETITRYSVSIVPLVPAMFQSLIDTTSLDLSKIDSVKLYLSGSETLSIETIKLFMQKTGEPIVEGYGLTEASPVTHIMPPGYLKNKLGSIGLPLPDTMCRIVDLETGETDVPIGEPGELIIKGPQVMIKYLNRPMESDFSLKDGWIYTQDIVTMDKDGFFYLIDRKNDMIVSRGYYIYPREVEELILEHPKVKEACVVNYPSPQQGEVAIAFVVVLNDERILSQELIEYCDGKIPAYKIPQKVIFLEKLPKNSVGKVLRRVLRSKKFLGELPTTI